MDLRKLRDKFKKQNPFDEIYEGGNGLNKWNYSPEYVDWLEKQLLIHSVVKSLPIQDLPNCTRVEVIDQNGRSYVNWKENNKVRLSMQDDGKTAKIFID